MEKERLFLETPIKFKNERQRPRHYRLLDHCLSIDVDQSQRLV